MRKLVVMSLAALVVMVPALAVVGPAQATPLPASAKPAVGSQVTAAQADRKKKRAKQKRARQAEMRTWDRLAQCESGGRWSINTGNGYYGGLQISPRTWRAFGGQRFAGLPHHASKRDQVTVAKRIKQGQGWGAWPSCSRKIGVR